MTAPSDAPGPGSEHPRHGSADDEQADDEQYEPVAVRSTYAPAHASGPTAGAESPYPSRRALRDLAIAEEAPAAEASDVTPTGWAPAAPATETPAATIVASAIVATENVAAEPLPVFTQVPEFTPEPVSALPPPVWTEPEAPAPAPESEAPAPAPEVEPLSVVEPTPEPEVAEPAAPVLVASAPVAVTHPGDDWAASLAGWDDVETTTDPPDALPIFGDAPPISYSQRAMRYQPLHGRTSPVWLIVFMPLIHGAALVGSLFLFPDAFAASASPTSFRPDSATIAAMSEWLMFAAMPLAIAFFLFTFIMGFQDRARLRLLGHDQTASPWWIVLHPLVYLIVRSIRVRQCTGRRGSGPLTTYLCFYVAPPIALAVATAVISALDGAIPA